MWSGDIDSGFQSMRRQTVRLVTAVALGQAKWGMDTGGFFSDPKDENYARWIQFSSLVPVFRVHGEQDKHRYPWAFNTMAEETAKNAIQLRYRLAPYIYACDRECFENGVGLVRPLMFEFPHDEGSAAVTDEWLFGKWLLAAPVLSKQASDAHLSTARSIYLPPGKWIDYFRGNPLNGGARIDYFTNAGVWTDIPLFIREGAIIFSQDLVPSLGKASPALAYVDVFPSPIETSSAFYDDDGATYAYENGATCKQRISARNDNHQTSIIVEAKEGPHESTVKSFLVRLHGRGATSVTLEAQPLERKQDLKQLKAEASGWIVSRDIYGPLTVVKVPAGAAQRQVISAQGDQDVPLTADRLEAEEASLAGPTVDQRTKTNTNHQGYSGTGFVDNFENVGAGITFNAKTQLPGYYPVTLRAANAVGHIGTLSLLVNGAPQGTAAVPSQADWNTWVDVPLQLRLAAGNNIISLRQMPTDTGRVNIDFLSVPFLPTSELYEVESAILFGGAQSNSNHLNFSGSGFVDKLENPGSGAKLSIFAPRDGQYRLATRFSNGTGCPQTMSLYLHGEKLKSVTFATTANWETWGTENETVTLSRGQNAVALQFDQGDSGHLNLDSFQLVP